MTTVEIKSGYGLDLENELKLLRAARRARSGERRRRANDAACRARRCRPNIPAVRAEYIALVCDEIIPAAARAGLADAVDAFCETIAFTRREDAARLRGGAQAGLPVKLHADQLSDCGGAALAAEFGALSADHLEHANDIGMTAMARAGTVAVLLPGAFYCLRETRVPPIARLRAHGIPVAIATDCNPGTLAGHLAAADAQHGLHAVPAHAGRGSCRRHAERRPRARPGRSRPARSRRRAPTSRYGTSASPRSLPTRWARIRCIGSVHAGRIVRWT